MAVTPHALFATALTDRGWSVLDRRQPSARSDNPTLLTVRRGRVGVRMVVYAWRITLEGQGRHKASGQLDYRVQTTFPGRVGGFDFGIAPGYTVVGLGWDSEREVFASFDPWIKRFAKWSDSVHIHRALLDDARRAGWAEEERTDGPEAAFVPDRVDGLFSWLAGLTRKRTVAVAPDEYHLRGSEQIEARVQSKQRFNPRATWLRTGDYLVVRDAAGLLDPHVWKVTTVDAEFAPPEPGKKKPRLFLTFTGTRHGIIRDDAWLSAIA
jgi:hypothetical protein